MNTHLREITNAFYLCQAMIKNIFMIFNGLKIHSFACKLCNIAFLGVIILLYNLCMKP